MPNNTTISLTDLYNIPLPPENPSSLLAPPPTNILSVSMSPPPFPSALASYLPETKIGIIKPSSNPAQESIRNFNCYSSPISVKVDNQCYQLPETKNEYDVPVLSSMCYQLSSIDSYSGTSVNSSNSDIPQKHFKNIDTSPTLNSHIDSLVSYKNKLKVLKSTENVPMEFLKSSQGEELKSKNDGEYVNVLNTPVLKAKDKLNLDSTPCLKRSCSVSDSDTTDSEYTPKRKITLIRYDLSPVRDSRFYHSRKSLPARITNSFSKDTLSSNTLSSKDRRKSFPSATTSEYSPSPIRTHKRCAADQTPYAASDSFQQRKRMRSVLPYYNALELTSLESESGFIDSHCHLDFLFDRNGFNGTYSEYQKKNRDTFPKCYRGCLAVFCNPFTFHKKYKWQKFLEEENVWASFGCHPHNAKDYNDDVEESLCAALEHSKVRALGEIGLDYSNRNNCMKEMQFKAFRRQLKIAVKKELPVVIHCRDAHEDGMDIIKEILPKDYTIHLHCFTDTWEWAQKWLDEFPNLFIGITNVVTFSSAESVHEVARKIPLDRLLLETDAPYFIPRMGPKGIRFSHPGMAIHVAAQIAALKTVPLEQVLHSTRKNTKRMYNI